MKDAVTGRPLVARTTCVRLPSAVPVKTVRTAWKPLPVVSELTRPLLGAVQRYQTERVAQPFSFGSLEAATLLPVTLPAAPVIVCAFAKSSLAGAATSAQLRTNVSAVEASTLTR